jgi:toxin ParE1/3/4
LLDAIEYYEARATGQGTEFLTDLEEALERLTRNPESGSSYRHDTRQMLLRRFPFRLIYSIDGGSIIVIAVAHQRRHPDYWSDRR